MILLLASFLVLLTWVTLANRVLSVSIPPESIELSNKIAYQFHDTAIPDYVFKYGTFLPSCKTKTYTDKPTAPLVYLDREETYFPSDISRHIRKTHPTYNFTDVPLTEKPTLDNLSNLNSHLDSEHIYLTSTKNVIDLPKFLQGKKPDAKTLQTHHAKSCAVIVVEKEDGIVDAFYMYFYSFNAGPHALGSVVGNHVGDWQVSLPLIL